MNPDIAQQESVKLVVRGSEQPTVEGFELLALIGSGGMGSVYKARQAAGDAIFAVKVLHPELARDPVNVRRFEQEAQACGKLDNPHVVNVYSYGTTTDGRPYLAMDYICGSALNEILSEEGFIEQKRFIDIFSQVCDALKLAHEQGIIHRDLKPGNIMLVRNESSNDFVKVVDFGIARTLQQTAKDGPRVTQTGDLLGSPTYMSPEQCLGQKLDVRSDIYSLGVVMYEALTGKLPFEADNAVQVLLQQINDAPQPLGKVRPDFEFSRRIERLVLTALEKRPEDRWQTIDEVLNELNALTNNEPIPASTVAPAPKKKDLPASKGHRNLLRVASIASVIMLAASVALSGLMHRPPQFAVNSATTSAATPRGIILLTPEEAAVGYLYGENFDAAGKALQAELDRNGKGVESDLLFAQRCLKYADMINSKVTIDSGAMNQGMAANALLGPIADYPGHETPRTRWAKTFLKEGLKAAERAKDNGLRLDIMQRLATVAQITSDEVAEERWLREFVKLNDASQARKKSYGVYEQLAHLVMNRGERTPELEHLLKQASEAQEVAGAWSHPGPFSDLMKFYDETHNYKAMDAAYEELIARGGSQLSYELPDWYKSLEARGLHSKVQAVKMEVLQNDKAVNHLPKLYTGGPK